VETPPRLEARAGAKAALDKALTIEPGSDWLKTKMKALEKPSS
jgi:hypothetical protein